MKRVLAAFVAGLIAMAAGAYWWVHHDIAGENAEPQNESEGRLDHETKTIPEGEVVDGIRKLNRLLVFRAYITARTTTHDVGWFSQSDQTMLTPAFVSYLIDMSEITERSVRVDGNKVTILRPMIRIERPNIDVAHTDVFNAGVWTTLDSTTAKLRLKNNAMALRQQRQRALMPFLFNAAKAAANDAVAANVHTILAASGHPELEIKVVR